MTTITLNVASTIVLPDGRTALVLDGPVSAPVAAKAIAATTPVQTTPKPKARKGRKTLTGEALAKQVAFWSGKASKGQIARIKEAGGNRNAKTYANMSSLEARAELGRVDPSAKLAVIAPEVLEALKA
jgi:hypothetical protein